MSAPTRGPRPARYAARSADLLERSRIVVSQNRVLKANIKFSVVEARSLIGSRRRWLLDQAVPSASVRGAMP